MLLDHSRINVNIENAKDKGTLYGAIQQMLYNDYWEKKGYQPERFLKMLFEKYPKKVDRYKA